MMIDDHLNGATEAIRTWASEQPLIKKLYLFGSRVIGGYREDSDLDIAIELTSPDWAVMRDYLPKESIWPAELLKITDFQVHLVLLHHKHGTPDFDQSRFYESGPVIIFERH